MNAFAVAGKKLRLGYWNVRTLYEAGKLVQVAREANRYNLSILGMSEIRWTGSGVSRTSDGRTLYYSGKDSDAHESGVGIMLDAISNICVLDWKPVNDRIMTLRLNSKHIKTTNVQVYTPHEGKPQAEKEEF